VLNYRTDQNWGETARKLSPGGEGVDHILEVGGAATLQQSLKAIKLEGVISIIGFLGAANPKGNPQIIDALSHVCTFRGVFVGSRAQMEEMVHAIETNDIHPLVDEVFPFEKALDGFEYLVSTFFDLFRL
jgi:NADPH:quinone reductase-like Zn-dependent oxidoreductase